MVSRTRPGYIFDEELVFDDIRLAFVTTIEDGN